MAKALAMISGGLDSILAAKLMKDQGVEVVGLCFKSNFFNEDSAKRMVKQIDVPLIVVDFSDEHMEMVKNPKHGYGKNMNPCIDCHAMMMRYAGKLLEEYDADFIITGEVLNQRPMSQNRAALNVVKKESGFEDKILRPLCAKLLPETKMELEGLVDRERLLDISGRTRKVQMELADKWGIVDYPSPAGGCKLTEPNYAQRLRDLLDHNKNPENRELELLKIGRHFRVSDNAKVISTRTGEEAENIKSLLNEKDLLFFAEEYSGSMVVVIGSATYEDIEFAAKASARYCKGKDQPSVKVKYGNFRHALDKHIEVAPAQDNEINEHLI